MVRDLLSLEVAQGRGNRDLYVQALEDIASDDPYRRARGFYLHNVMSHIAALQADLPDGAKARLNNGTDSERITIYALRHSSIVRQILRGVPVRVVAVMHDTSVAMIEKNYSKFLADHSDAIARAALFEIGESAGGASDAAPAEETDA